MLRSPSALISDFFCAFGDDFPIPLVFGEDGELAADLAFFLASATFLRKFATSFFASLKGGEEDCEELAISVFSSIDSSSSSSSSSSLSFCLCFSSLFFVTAGTVSGAATDAKHTSRFESTSCSCRAFC